MLVFGFGPPIADEFIHKADVLRDMLESLTEPSLDQLAPFQHEALSDQSGDQAVARAQL
jgi:hypothetical protein